MNAADKKRKQVLEEIRRQYNPSYLDVLGEIVEGNNTYSENTKFVVDGVDYDTLYEAIDAASDGSRRAVIDQVFTEYGNDVHVRIRYTVNLNNNRTEVEATVSHFLSSEDAGTEEDIYVIRERVCRKFASIDEAIEKMFAWAEEEGSSARFTYGARSIWLSRYLYSTQPIKNRNRYVDPCPISLGARNTDSFVKRHPHFSRG